MKKMDFMIPALLLIGINTYSKVMPKRLGNPVKPSYTAINSTKFLKNKVITSPSAATNPEMVHIKGGTFTMDGIEQDYDAPPYSNRKRFSMIPVLSF